jgi:hypothetical protein
VTAEPRKVNFREFRTNLSTYLREAHDGAEMFKDRLQMAPDFDETPAELIDEMEGGT